MPVERRRGVPRRAGERAHAVLAERPGYVDGADRPQRRRPDAVGADDPVGQRRRLPARAVVVRREAAARCRCSAGARRAERLRGRRAGDRPQYRVDPVVRLSARSDDERQTGSQPAVTSREPHRGQAATVHRRQRRLPRQAPGLRLPVRRDLRRHPVGLGLRPARRRAQGEHQAPVVEGDGAARDDMVGLDSSVILPRQTWEASGHVDTFTDPLTECQSCHKRFRADHLQEEIAEKKGIDDPDDVDLNDGRLPQLRHPRRLDRAAPVLRPAQDLPRRDRGRVRAALPAPRDRAGHLPQLRQRGDLEPRRSRRSASPRSARASATRSRPATSSSAPASSSRWRWSSSSSPARTRSGTSTGSTSAPAGTSTSASTRTTCATSSTRRRSSATTPSAPSTSSTASASPAREWGELEGIANRTDFDLTTHAKHSGQDLSLLRPGHQRALLALRHRAGRRPLAQPDDLPRRRLRRGRGAQHQGRRRQAHRAAARPAAGAGQGRGAAAVAATPTSRRRPRTSPPSCAGNWNVDFDDSGAIGRRYRRQDEIGTPYCVTVDFDTLDDHAVTVRERDTMAQERVPLDGDHVVLRRAFRRLLTASCPCTMAGVLGRAPTLSPLVVLRR